MGSSTRRIAITGSNGLVGSHLVEKLQREGHSVLRLVSSKAKPGDGVHSWQPLAPLPAGLLNGCHAVVHLAGAGIADGRWTAARKQELRTSRIETAKHLAHAVDRDGVPHFLSGSAIGYYGDRGEEILDENAAAGTGFLAELCRDWEEAAKCNARVVNLRTSHVLWPGRGLLGKLVPPIRWFAGAMLGSGRQYMPWISAPDIAAAIAFLIENDSLSGPVNLCTATPATNRELSKAVARVLHRPCFLHAPLFALRILFGEMADGALLTSQRTVPAKLEGAGFRFQHPDLEPCLRELLG